jgi:hypothetical protein
LSDAVQREWASSSSLLSGRCAVCRAT